VGAPRPPGKKTAVWIYPRWPIRFHGHPSAREPSRRVSLRHSEDLREHTVNCYSPACILGPAAAATPDCYAHIIVVRRPPGVDKRSAYVELDLWRRRGYVADVDGPQRRNPACDERS